MKPMLALALILVLGLACKVRSQDLAPAHTLDSHSQTTATLKDSIAEAIAYRPRFFSLGATAFSHDAQDVPRLERRGSTSQNSVHSQANSNNTFKPPHDPPLNADVPFRHVLYGGEAISKGMVWDEYDPRYKDMWVQKEVNSCAWCAPPMTWKHALFDKKALALWIPAVVMGVVDTEYTLSRPCIRQHTCTEGNPLLGTSRAQQYGVRMPMLAVAWLGGAWVRKGDLKYRIGGYRRWYLIPVTYIASPTIGFLVNVARFH
jgi:hypothetical protein